MTNESIRAAFERFWLHVVAIIGTKADADHTHDDLYYTTTAADATFAKTEAIPAKTSQLTNDSGFITADDIPEVEIPDQVQADYNQNDETAPDYIKNRPFYTSDPTEVEYIPQTTVTIEHAAEYYPTSWAYICNGDAIVEGQEYKVTWDGTVYNCVGLLLDNTPFIGNPNIWWYGGYADQDNGMPFCIAGYADGTIRVGVFANTSSNITEHTVICETISRSVYKIDRKYLPDGICTIKTIPSAECPINGPEDILNLPTGYYILTLNVGVYVQPTDTYVENGNWEYTSLHGLIYKNGYNIVSYNGNYTVENCYVDSGELYSNTFYDNGYFGWAEAENIIGSGTLDTDSKTLVGAINEINTVSIPYKFIINRDYENDTYSTIIPFEYLVEAYKKGQDIIACYINDEYRLIHVNGDMFDDTDVDRAFEFCMSGTMSTTLFEENRSYSEFYYQVFRVNCDGTVTHWSIDSTEVLNNLPLNSLNTSAKTIPGAINELVGRVGDSVSSDLVPTKTSQLINDSGFITNSDLSTYETETNAITRYNELTDYADTAASNVKNELLNGAGAAYDTLKELGELIDENNDAIDALNTVAANKVDRGEVTELMSGKQDKESTEFILKSSDVGSNKKFKITIGDDGVLTATEIETTE